jgi:hypothetical protein
MNKLFSFVLVAVVAFSSQWASASSSQEKAIKAVESQVELLRKAMVDADAVKLKTLTLSELNYGHSGGHVENQAEFIQKIVSGTSDFVTMDLNDQSVSVVGDIAIVRHMLVAKTNDRGVAGEVTIGVMLIWKKQRGDWKLLARQAFKMH